MRTLRTIPQTFETREDGDLRIIEGYFAVFDSVYQIADGMSESINRHAFDKTISGDIRCLINHDTTLVLGRTKAHTLELRVDEHGLWGKALINPNDTDAAYLNGINYPEFFKDFSDENVFNACIMLNKRNAEKAFTANLLVKKLGITLKKSEMILDVLRKYKLVYTSQIEMDDEIKTVFHFYPTPSFIALLIFAREIIDRPNSYCYNCSYRRKPYL